MHLGISSPSGTGYGLIVLTKRNWPQGRFDTPGQSPGFLLWQATKRWQRLIRAALAPFGVTHVQFVLSEGDVAITQKPLSEHCATDPMMTSQVLRTLEQEGQDARTRDPVDARAWLLALTAGGYRKLGRRLISAEPQSD
jgi:DNA-binding MarR family transcriptional regulator